KAAHLGQLACVKVPPENQHGGDSLNIGLRPTDRFRRRSKGNAAPDTVLLLIGHVSLNREDAAVPQFIEEWHPLIEKVLRRRGGGSARNGKVLQGKRTGTHQSLLEHREKRPVLRLHLGQFA